MGRVFRLRSSAHRRLLAPIKVKTGVEETTYTPNFTVAGLIGAEFGSVYYTAVERNALSPLLRLLYNLFL